ncbi:MAG TPA: glycoside hydrolase family 127 protein [Trebonia sp.]
MREIGRRQAMALLGSGVLLAADARHGGGRSSAWWGDVGAGPAYRLSGSGYTPDGTAGRTAAYPLSAVRLLDSPFLDNQRRNLSYLLYLDPDRMLHTFRLNYGQRSGARPIGGWESPDSQVRGHTVGHLMSALAISYANTADPAAKAAGAYLVGELASLQRAAPQAGYSTGYLSAFPEEFFAWLEAGQSSRVWSPYYMIHKYLAGLIDFCELAGSDQALDVATRLADWVDRRTAPLSYAHMQLILAVEFGGLPESLVNLYAITGNERYLAVAQRFYHAWFLDPLAAGRDDLAGEQCNVNTPKITAALRMWEVTGEAKYRDIAENFWQFATGQHSYVTGGQGDHEHWNPPGVIAAALSNYTCEGCVTYNMLKLTRLLHFHDQARTDVLDYYERALFNHMLGTQDPDSPHGFNCYYSGLSAGAVKQQPLNYFPGGDPDAYATDYDTFTCDTGTGLETQAKFADTIYSRDSRGVYVNLFIPSEVRCADHGLTIRQETGFPDDPVVRLTVTSGAAPMTLRVRVPSWAAGPPGVTLNGAPLRNTVTGGWVTILRRWTQGDQLAVTLPMRLAFHPAPDALSVQAASYGPVVLAGRGVGAAYASPDAATDAVNDATLLNIVKHPAVAEGEPPPQPPALPLLDTASVRRSAASPMTFAATADGRPVTLVPVARARHEPFTVYWRTS